MRFLIRRRNDFGLCVRDAERGKHAACIVFVDLFSRQGRQQLHDGFDFRHVGLGRNGGRRPVVPGANRVGARFRSAEAGHPTGGEQPERSFGVRREEHRERFATAVGLNQGLDRDLGLKLG